MHYSSQNGHVDVVQILIENGAAVDVMDDSKDTPLTLASSNGHCLVAKTLVTKGANVNHQEEDGYVFSNDI